MLRDHGCGDMPVRSRIGARTRYGIHAGEQQ
jgi:hypothetical protein